MLDAIRQKLQVYPSFVKSDNQFAGRRYRERFVAPYHEVILNLLRKLLAGKEVMYHNKNGT